MEDIIDLDFSVSDVALLLLDDTKIIEGKNINLPVPVDSEGNPLRRESGNGAGKSTGSLQSSLLNVSHNTSMVMMKSLLQENQFANSQNNSMHNSSSMGSGVGWMGGAADGYSALPRGVLGGIGGSDGLKLHSCGVDPTTGSLTLFGQQGQQGQGQGPNSMLNTSRLSMTNMNTTTNANILSNSRSDPNATSVLPLQYDTGVGDDDNEYDSNNHYDDDGAGNEGDQQQQQQQQLHTEMDTLTAPANMRHSQPPAALINLSALSAEEELQELQELKIRQMLTLLDPHEEYSTVNQTTHTVTKQPSHALRRGKPFKIPTLWKDTISRNAVETTNTVTGAGAGAAPSLGSVLNDQYMCNSRRSSNEMSTTSSSTANSSSWMTRRYLSIPQARCSSSTVTTTAGGGTNSSTGFGCSSSPALVVFNPQDAKKLQYPAALQDCYTAQKKALLLRRLQQNRTAFTATINRRRQQQQQQQVGGSAAELAAALENDDDAALDHLLASTNANTNANSDAAEGEAHNNSYHHPSYDPQAGAETGGDNDGYDGGGDGDEMDGYWFRDELQNDDDDDTGAAAASASSSGAIAGVDGFVSSTAVNRAVNATDIGTAFIGNRFEDEDEEEEWLLTQRVERALNSSLAGTPGSAGTVSYETLCRQHIANFNKDAEVYAQESQLARRVAEWTAKLEPLLAREEALMNGTNTDSGSGNAVLPSPCDIGVFSTRILTAVRQLSPPDKINDEGVHGEKEDEAAETVGMKKMMMPTVVRVQFPELVAQVQRNTAAEEQAAEVSRAGSARTSVSGSTPRVSLGTVVDDANVDQANAMGNKADATPSLPAINTITATTTTVNDVSRLFMACLQLANLGEIVIIPAGCGAEQAASLVTTAVQLQRIQQTSTHGGGISSSMNQQQLQGLVSSAGGGKLSKKKVKGGGKRSRGELEAEEEEEAATATATAAAVISEANTATPSEATLALTAKLLREFHKNASASTGTGASSSSSSSNSAGTSIDPFDNSALAFSICRITSDSNTDSGSGTGTGTGTLVGASGAHVTSRAVTGIGRIVAKSAATASALVTDGTKMSPSPLEAEEMVNIGKVEDIKVAGRSKGVTVKGKGKKGKGGPTSNDNDSCSSAANGDGADATTPIVVSTRSSRRVRGGGNP